MFLLPLKQPTRRVFLERRSRRLARCVWLGRVGQEVARVWRLGVSFLLAFGRKLGRPTRQVAAGQHGACSPPSMKFTSASRDRCGQVRIMESSCRLVECPLVPRAGGRASKWTRCQVRRARLLHAHSAVPPAEIDQATSHFIADREQVDDLQDLRGGRSKRVLHESKSREWDATLTRSPSGTVQRCSTTFQSATSLLRSLNSAVAVWEGRRCLTLSKPRRREGG